MKRNILILLAVLFAIGCENTQQSKVNQDTEAVYEEYRFSNINSRDIFKNYVFKISQDSLKVIDNENNTLICESPIVRKKQNVEVFWGKETMGNRSILWSNLAMNTPEQIEVIESTHSEEVAVCKLIFNQLFMFDDCLFFYDNKHYDYYCFKKMPFEEVEKPNPLAEIENEFEILLPFFYESYEGENRANNLNSNWIELYNVNGEYFLDNAEFTLERNYSECIGDTIIDIKTARNALVYMNNPALKKGKVSSLPIKTAVLFPSETTSFEFNGVKYTVSAAGKMFDSGNPTKTFDDIRNYELYIETERQPKQLLISIDRFTDTQVELLFVGDIDGDGKLDFIFDTSTFYEEKSVVLFLSSKAKGEEVVRKASDIFIGFGC